MNPQCIEFQTFDGLTLRGWFYSQETIAPTILMTSGFSALKEHGLKRFAERFFAQGFHVLIYDHRNFGDSDQQIRFEVDPYLQIADLRASLRFLEKKTGIDKNRIGVWGTSFSGAHVIRLAVLEPTIRCVVATVPFIQGHHASLQEKRPDVWKILQKKYAQDKKQREEKNLPIMTPVVTADPDKSAIMKGQAAYEFFTAVPQWVNSVTLRSIENSGNYEVITVLENLKTPILFIVAKQDEICLTSLALAAFDRIKCQKKQVLIEGHHFSLHHENFEICVLESIAWFKRFLY